MAKDTKETGDATEARKAAPKRTVIDDRVYEDRGDGRLTEVADPKMHATRMLNEIGTGKNHTITGLRISNVENPDAPAVVVTLSREEAGPVMDAVRAALTARTK